MKLIKWITSAFLLIAPVHAAVFDWSNTCTTWHFNPHDVRDPTIVFNNTNNTAGSCPGYDGTVYAFSPCNFVPNTQPAMCSNGTGPTIACAGNWTSISLTQLGLPITAKEVILTGSGQVYDEDTVSYVWARATGSMWQLSPIVNIVGETQISIHVPVGINSGQASIDLAWGLNGNSNASAWLSLILSGWCE